MNNTQKNLYNILKAEIFNYQISSGNTKLITSEVCGVLDLLYEEYKLNFKKHLSENKKIELN